MEGWMNFCSDVLESNTLNNNSSKSKMEMVCCVLMYEFSLLRVMWCGWVGGWVGSGQGGL